MIMVSSSANIMMMITTMAAILVDDGQGTYRFAKPEV